MVGGPSRTKKRKLSSASEENDNTANDITGISAAMNSATDTGGVEVAAPKEGPNNTVAVAAESKKIMTTTKTDPLKSKNDNNDEDEEEEVSC